jgi:IS30 family transposase
VRQGREQSLTPHRDRVHTITYDNVTEKELENIMEKLNHRPRKSLGWRTPYELFFNRKTLLTVALAS